MFSIKSNLFPYQVKLDVSVAMELVFLFFLSSVLRQPFSLFTACSTRHCGTSACLLEMEVRRVIVVSSCRFLVSYVVPQAVWAESLSCYFLTSFATSVRTSFGTSWFQK